MRWRIRLYSSNGSVIQEWNPKKEDVLFPYSEDGSWRFTNNNKRVVITGCVLAEEVE